MKDIEKALQRADTRIKPDTVTSTATAESTLEVMKKVADPRVENNAAEVKTTDPATRFKILHADYDNFRLQSGARSKRAVSVDGAFRVLRTQVLDGMAKQNLRVVGITSPTAGAGKTMTSIQLAMACARRADQNIVLADFDYRRPAVAEYLSASNFKSSTAYFRGNEPVQNFLTQNEEGNLFYLLTREPTDMSAEYLASPRMDEALRSLTRDRDTVVIVDLPPLIGCDDTMAIMPKLDGVILVVGCGDHSYTMMEQVQEMIPSEKLIGAVLNRVPHVDAKYKYTYNVAT